MGQKSRRKGADGEREVVALARAAKRTWHLAQSPDAAERACDVRIGGHPFQVKRRRHRYAGLYEGLRDVAGLFVRSDGREWLAVVPAAELFRLLRRAGESSA